MTRDGLHTSITRRKYLLGAAASTIPLAGCAYRSNPKDDGGNNESVDIGSRTPDPDSGLPAPATLAELPDLSGDLTVYLGRGEGGLYSTLVDFLRERYADFSVTLKRGPSASLANTILTESNQGQSRADVFWSIDAASLGIVARSGLARPFPEPVAGLVPDQFSDDDRRWLGISGRARSIPYNTDELSESDVPDSVFDLPGRSGFQNGMGWAPSYGSFQAFVTAMRLLEGEDRTRQWLNEMQQAGTASYAGEFGATLDVAEGTIDLALANHYYTLRLMEGRPNAPLDLAFTTGGAGSLINVGGALVLGSSDVPKLATDFVHHLLTFELQDFLSRKAFEYPLVPGVDPPGSEAVSLPPITDLAPPDLDLTKLADLKPTLALLRDTGVL